MTTAYKELSPLEFAELNATDACRVWEGSKEAAREAKYAAFVEKEIAELTEAIAADNDALAETVRWWDVECFERLETDTQLGTAREFAERLYEEGWRLNMYKRIECGACQETPIQLQSGNRV